MLETLLVAIDVQDAFLLQVEVHALGMRPCEKMFASRDGQTGGFDGVALVMRDVRNELGKPAQLVPAWAGVDQQRRIALQHPLQALEDGGPVRPDLGVGSRQLAAVGKRCFHRRITVFFKQGHGKAAPGQGISGSDAGDAAADDCD